MQTNLLLDDSQMNKLSNEESQKVYKEMVKQTDLTKMRRKRTAKKQKKPNRKLKPKLQV